MRVEPVREEKKDFYILAGVHPEILFGVLLSRAKSSDFFLAGSNEYD